MLRKFLRVTAGNADLAGEAGGEESLARAHGAADDVAHREHVGSPRAQGGCGVLQLLLGGSWPATMERSYRL